MSEDAKTMLKIVGTVVMLFAVVMLTVPWVFTFLNWLFPPYREFVRKF